MTTRANAGSSTVLVMVGTAGGAFLLSSDAERRRWKVRGPLSGRETAVGYVAYDIADGSIYAAGISPAGAPAVGRSADRGETWTWSNQGLALGSDRPSVNKVWSLTADDGVVYAGIDPAGLFRSDDRGESWRQVGTPLLDHPSASEWRGGKGGLCLHSIVRDPADPDRLWVAMAGGGVMFTSDAGQTWQPRNPRVGDPTAPRPALRVQRIERSNGPDWILYQQNHLGVFRSADDGVSWADVTADLPSRFGFPLALHPRDSHVAYVIPHVNEGNRRYVAGQRLAVWRGGTGETWQKLTNGLPTEIGFAEVLRQGLSTDELTPAGLYFGTVDGRLFGSRDEGETWSTLATGLPAIYSVTTAIVE